MTEPDAIDVGSRVLFDGRPGTVISATPVDSGPGWFTIRLDTGELVSPSEGHPHLQVWSPATPSERMRQWRRLFSRQILEDVRARRLQVDQADRLMGLVS